MSQVGVHENYLGGDAQVATQVVLHDVGALLSLLRPAATLGSRWYNPRYVGAAIIFRDPIGASGAACDCDALLRLINVRTRPQMQNKTACAHETSDAEYTPCLRECEVTPRGYRHSICGLY